MSKICRKLPFVLVVCTSAAICTWAQQTTGIPAAPIPSQISSARKIFVSNAGEETSFRLPKDDWYSGGPNRTYDQFYAAMKSWGRYELVSTPADADLVFEVGLTDRDEAPIPLSQLKLVVIDSKTRIPLWTIFKYPEFAGMAKNREKNYDSAMASLVEEVKLLASSSSGPRPNSSQP